MNTPGISLHAVSICSRRQKKNGWSLGETGADGGFRPTTSLVIYLETIVVTASVWQANGNLPTPSQRFYKKESGLDTAVEIVATVSMQIADKEAKYVSGHSDIPVAIDGTWQKQGHTSLDCTVIATSVYTGKVLDASILSRFLEVWKFREPSKSSNALRYTKFWGDGDSRAYKAVNEMHPYGDIDIGKLECVGYVEKWMETRLRALKLKKKARAMEIADWERLRKANYDILQNSLEAMVKKKHKKCIFEDTLAEVRKNPGSGAGMH
ncbi:uncharacterized protein TNCV_254781 [Trichonephila clavipes]|nr:uncharacterized protein TNCV_254781 [Trichonephila clavipes]